MRCVAFCTASSYKIGAIHAFFRAKNFKLQLYRKILHITNKDYGDIFVFPHGCFVTWGLTSREELRVLNEISSFAVLPLAKPEIDHFIFRYAKKTNLFTDQRFGADTILLGTNKVPAKLAVSFGLAQSIKLGSYEEAIQNVIDKNSNLATKLAATGKIPLTKRVILQRMGEISIARNSINLSSDFLDIPEYFWEFPSGENYYLMSSRFLDVSKRVSILNQKLDVLQELLAILTNQLQHRHSSFLEVIIILLIVFEIIISLSQYF